MRLPSPCGDHALFRLAFATAPGVNPLTSPHGSNSPAHSSKGTQSDIPVNGHSPLTACKHTVSGTFNSPSGVLFTFPSRYLFTIGHQGVFRLGGWSPHVQTGFHVSRPTQGSTGLYAYGAITRYGRTFQTVLLISCEPLACSAFARHY